MPCLCSVNECSDNFDFLVPIPNAQTRMIDRMYDRIMPRNKKRQAVKVLALAAMKRAYKTVTMFCPLTVVIWLASIHITYLAAEPNCVPDFMGEPKYEACRNLLFGDGNPASLDRYGIAAIDEKRHAFTIAGAQREQESDTEWALRIRLPKFWKNCRDPRDHPPKFRQ
ncbi:MAG: hypothetical protein L6R40_000299 [Gallowayella cf. fulva]|nr:MAG: hypothetical protein L6R40_000299 [Xanthomendoza cf. fulva]